MAKDLLEGVNRLLIKVEEIESRNKLTSLTDSSRQVFIDGAVDSLNEVMDELYTLFRSPRPRGIKSATITLVDGQREYSLNSKMTRIRADYHLIDETNDHVIEFVDNLHRDLVFADLGQDDTGLPTLATINPETNRLFVDRAPTSVEAGRIYKYRYERDLELTEATDEFPFSSTVLRAVVPAAAQLWKRDHRGVFDGPIFRASLARAARFLRQSPARNTYGPTQYRPDPMDPYHASSVS